jgi:hypothetical protein
MHNFVLACPNCNRSKSDSLAARIHLDKWAKSVKKNDEAITQIGGVIGIVTNLETSLSIAEWSYGTTIGGKANGWIKAGQYEGLKQ